MAHLLAEIYVRFLDYRGRVTFRSLGLFDAAYACVAVAVVTSWRAAFASEPPTALIVLCGTIPLFFWLSPLMVWVLRAIRSDGLLRYHDLNASAGVVLSWGILVAFIFPYDRAVGSRTIVEHIAVAIVAGMMLVAAFRLLHRVALVHFAAGLGIAGALTIVAIISSSRIAAWLHLQHLAGHFTDVRRDRLAAWSLIASLTVGAASVIALHWTRRLSEGTARPLAVRTVEQAATPTIAASPWSQRRSEDEPTTPRAGFGAWLFLQRAEREAERKRAAFEAEQALFSVLEPLAALGWQIEASIWLREERIGDIDALVRAPSGLAYAIDAKSHRDDCTIEYGEALGDLVAVYPAKAHNTNYLAVAQRQVGALHRHGYGVVQPVLCFTRARLACAQYISGVAVLTLGELLTFLECEEARHPSAPLSRLEGTDVLSRQ